MSKKSFPEPTVGALIFNNEEKVLIMKSYKWGDQYALPGGHIEIGETMEQAIVREVKEETNLNVFDVRFVSFFEVIFDPAFWEKKHFIFFDFVCRTNESNVVLNDEAEEYEWVETEEVFNYPLESNTRKFLLKYFSK